MVATWQAAKSTEVKRAAGEAEEEDFEVYVERKRREAAETRNTAALHAKLAELESKEAGLTRRYQIRERVRVAREVRVLQAAIQRRESGMEQAALEAVLQQYVDAFELAAVSSLSGGGSSTRSRKRAASGMVKAGSRGDGSSIKAAGAGARAPVLRVSHSNAEGVERRHYTQDSVKYELMTVLGQSPPVYTVQCDMCTRCNVPMLVLASDALLGCPQCSQTRLYIQATSSHIAYGEEVEFASFSYKRQNHLYEWLNMCQAKEPMEVPRPVLEQVMEELYSQKKVREVGKVTRKKVRETLKSLKLRKYYDNAPQITARLTGKLPPRMSPFQQEQIKLMFAASEGPWMIHRPQERKNFLSYPYVLYKMCELCGYDKFLSSFELLKGKDKLVAMDKIWRKICQELDWQFIPSVAEHSDPLLADVLVKWMTHDKREG